MSGGVDNTIQGDTQLSRLARLRASVASRIPSISRRRHNLAMPANEADESGSSINSTAPSIRNSPANEPSPANGAERANAAAGPANRTNAPNETTPLDRLALTSRFAASLAAATSNTSQRPPTITASGSPSLILRVSTDDGGSGPRVNPRARGTPAAGATPTFGGASRPGGSASRAGSGALRSGGAAAAGRGALADVVTPLNGALPDRARAGGAQAARNRPAVGESIAADGVLPAAGGAPAVGTMPAIGRVAYITVQAPDNQFYTVRIDLTDAAPNATYNITINIPPP
ncbi:hypothetical protein UCDDA912_g08034 [Diaporthe ampelina]|uniref:Uncharacterized protein n=1 Tax=Diaporthe ampelina TaxID=1214573 RepID=A0A0G2FCX1_9PEZI|nr:hypothetical protein UCDDA912_g08034 [Diaporthe ampelina]